MHESFLAYRRRRYLWVALAISSITIAAYWLHDPQEPPNGGTLLGYTLGTLGALMILWLAWFGVRKRRYASTAGTVQGWLSAHVYLGIALLVVVLLHTGFQFGWNVHTLAFALLVVVIASGIYGVVVYLRYPGRMSTNRGGASRPELFDQLEDLDRRARRVASNLEDPFPDVVQSGIARTELGGTLWARFRGKDASRIMLPHSDASELVQNTGQEAVLDWLADQQSRTTDAEAAARVGELSALLRNKRKLLRQLREDLRLQATLELWLYAHVPLTVALLAALAVHILTVFLYW